MMDRTERATFDGAVAGVLADTWGGPGAAPAGSLEKVWAAAADAGWLELAEIGAVDALVRAVHGTGRVACPLPLADAWVAAELLRGPHPELAEQVGAGTLRPLVVTGPAARRRLDAAAAATHVLDLTEPGTARLAPITDRTERPGVAVPPLSTVELGEPVCAVPVPVPEAERRRAVAILRLALAVRAVAAAGRSHELAIEHAGIRHQFGRPIGGFGAVQQRIAESHIAISGARLLVDEAVRLTPESAAGSTHDDGRWLLAVELAVEHARSAASQVQFGAQHTLGAIGFFEEHDAPWLFRRVHTDIARLHDLPADGVADHLLGAVEPARESLPPVDADADAASFRGWLRGFLAESGLLRNAPQPHVDDPGTVAALADAGLFGLTWPAEHGGRGLRAAEQSVLLEEVGYGRVAAYTALNAVTFLGNAIIGYGTPAQREQFLPVIRRGGLRFCLGYSEPETGSDLAALVTRAVPQGDGWVVDGAKTWTTRAQASDWIWLAARTDPDRSLRHRGITVFLLPLSTPGITIDEHRSQAGEISCTVFFDGVHVPDTARIGEVNGGWAVVNTALAGERVGMGAITGTLHALLDDLLARLRDDPGLAPPGSVQRAHLTTLATRLQATRLLVRDAVEATTAGSGSRLEAPMAGVMGGEVAEQFGTLVPEILGPEALIPGPEDTSGTEVFSHNLLLSIKYVVGGGTNDVLRGLVARSLGLPR